MSRDWSEEECEWCAQQEDPLLSRLDRLIQLMADHIKIHDDYPAWPVPQQKPLDGYRVNWEEYDVVCPQCGRTKRWYDRWSGVPHCDTCHVMMEKKP